MDINISLKKVKSIYHVSDIHIRNLKRHREYLQVFKNLEEEIKKDTEDAIILINGDVAHAKTDMSPELVFMISVFFKRLADLLPTFVITGNHDCNLNNPDRLDVLQPIISALNHPNLFYLRETGIYPVANIDLIVFSIFDNMKNFIKSDKSTAEYKIGLYHGVVNNATTDTGFKLKSNLMVHQFNGYDIVALGDIHRYQTLQNFQVENKKIDKVELDKYLKNQWFVSEDKGDKIIVKRKKPSIAYSSSLIQQNHGEEYRNHGIIKWDVETRFPNFVPIHNDFGFYTLRIQDGELPKITDLPKFPRLRVEIKNTSLADVKTIIAKVKRKYKVSDVVINILDDKLDLDKQKLAGSDIIGNIYDTHHQMSLIKEYLDNTYNHVESEILDEIKKINSDLNSRLSKRDLQENTIWKLKTMKFSNLFSYGPNNFVDFEAMNGINGLFAPNTAGKSSLIDILLFTLFDKSSRSTKGLDVINVEKDDFHIKLNFEIGGVNYFIEKFGTRNIINGQPAVKVLIDFWRETDQGEKVSLNGDQRRSTKAIISDYIGTFENLILTNVSLQDNNAGIIKESKSGRNSLLSSFIGLDVFEKLFNFGNIEYKVIQGMLKEFQKKTLDQDLADAEQIIEKEEEKLTKIVPEIETNKTLIKQVNEKIIDLSHNIIKIDTDYELDVEKLTEEKDKILENIEEINSNLTQNAKDLGQVTDQAKNLYEEFTKFDSKALYQSHESLKKYRLKAVELKTTIDKIKIKKQFQEEKLKQLQDLEYDENCNYCMNNVFVKDAIKTKDDHKQTEEELTKVFEDLNVIQKLVSESSNIELDIKKLEELNKLKDQLKTIFEQLQSSSFTLSEQNKLQENLLKSIDEKIEIYYKNQSAIETNKELQIKILSGRKLLKEIEDKAEELGRKEKTSLQEVSIAKTKKNEIVADIEKIKTYEIRHKAYKYYLQAIHRNGIPYELIKKTIPVFETEVNAVLNQIADFNILVHFYKNYLDLHIVYQTKKTWSLTLTSGMEKFISSLAIRVALNRISTIPKPNFLILDEGFGSLDSENLSQLFILFNYLRNKFDFTLVVSHLDSMRDVIDQLIEIKKTDGFSNINFVK